MTLSATYLRWSALLSLLVLVIGAPLLLGGALPWAAAVIAAASVVAAVLGWLAFRNEPRVQRGSVLIWAFGIALVWTFIQLLPLPCGFVATVAPGSVAELTASLAALGQPEPTMCTISVDPGGTQQALVVTAGLTAAFLAAFFVAAGGHRRFVFGSVAASALVMCAAAWSHELALAESVFGVYEPQNANPRLMAPIMNDNNLAGFLLLAVPILIGLGITEEERERKVLWFIGAALAAASTVFTLSRGGIASLVLALVFFAALTWKPWKRRSRGKKRGSKEGGIGFGAATGALAAAAGIALGIYAAAGAVGREFSEKGYEKLDLLIEGAQFALASPLVGVGRGGWSAAFVGEHGRQFRFEHAENLPAQWITEWGFPVAIVLFALFGWALLRATKRAGSAVAIGGIAGIVALAAHNLVDFGLELPGIATCAVIVIAAVTAPRRRDVQAGALRERAFRFGAPAMGLAAAAVVILVGPQLPSVSTSGLREELETAWKADDPDAFQSTLQRAVLLHPAEPTFALLAGAEARHRRDSAAPHWLNRAMQLAPQWTAPHIEAARWLSSRGQMDQAMLEIREAGERNPASARVVLCETLRRQPDPALALRAAPGGVAGLDLLEQASGCMPEDAEGVDELDAYILSRDPSRSTTRLRSAYRMLGRDPEQAAEKLRALILEFPELGRAHEYLGRALLEMDQPLAAVEALRKAEEHVSDTTPLLTLRARAEVECALASSDPAEKTAWAERMRETVQELRGLSRGEPAAIADAVFLRGDLEDRLGRQLNALDAYLEARRFMDDPAQKRARIIVNQRIAALAGELGRRWEAREAYRELCDLNPENPENCRSAEGLAELGARELSDAVGQPSEEAGAFP